VIERGGLGKTKKKGVQGGEKRADLSATRDERAKIFEVPGGKGMQGLRTRNSNKMESAAEGNQKLAAAGLSSYIKVRPPRVHRHKEIRLAGPRKQNTSLVTIDREHGVFGKKGAWRKVFLKGLSLNAGKPNCKGVISACNISGEGRNLEGETRLLGQGLESPKKTRTSAQPQRRARTNFCEMDPQIRGKKCQYL